MEIPLARSTQYGFDTHEGRTRLSVITDGRRGDRVLYGLVRP